MPRMSLQPVAEALAEHARQAASPSPPTASATSRRRRSRRMKRRRRPAAGEHPLPRGRGEERSRLRRRQLAALGDIYVNDAFSAAHRAHASTEGLGHVLPAFAGRTMQAELEALDQGARNPERPVVAVVGGAKVSTKIDLLGNLVDEGRRARHRRRHGQHLPAAQGIDVGKSLCREGPGRHRARRSWTRREQANCAIILPVDAVVAERVQGQRAAATRYGARRDRRRRA